MFEQFTSALFSLVSSLLHIKKGNKYDFCVFTYITFAGNGKEIIQEQEKKNHNAMPFHINDTHSLGGNVRKRKNIRNLMKNNACLKRLMHCPDINNMVNKGKASCYDSRRNKKLRGNEENIFGIFYICVEKYQHQSF